MTGLSSIGYRMPAPSIAPRSGSGAAFGVGLTDTVGVALPSSAPAETTGSGRSAPVGMTLMLGLQESMTADAGDREARHHAQGLLAALADLQRALLGGGAGDALQKLTLLAGLSTQATDPVLNRVITSIRLRARLELARAAAAMPDGHAGTS